jgi:hypothetical protein
MATISKTGISNGSTIESEHITRIIDALDGTSSAEIVATGSFTGSFTGTVRASKEHVLVTNSTAVTGHPSDSGIYPGMIASIDLSASPSNAVYFTLGSTSEYQPGDRYEFIITKIQGSSEQLRIDCNAADRIYGTVLGVDNVNLYKNSATDVQSGAGNGVPGDRIVFTVIETSVALGWNLQGQVSGSAGYL